MNTKVLCMSSNLLIDNNSKISVVDSSSELFEIRNIRQYVDVRITENDFKNNLLKSCHLQIMVFLLYQKEN